MAHRQLRVHRLDGQTSDDDVQEHSPSERVQMVWPLTRQAWAFKQAASSEEHSRALATDALEMALRQRSPDEGLIHHSDRGCQYASEDQQEILAVHQILGSMSRRGNCLDNAPVESFFGTLKTERVRRRRYRTRSEARRDIFQYIEVFYNRKRLHSSLGYVSPMDFEAQHHSSREPYLAAEG